MKVGPVEVPDWVHPKSESGVDIYKWKDQEGYYQVFYYEDNTFSFYKILSDNIYRPSDYASQPEDYKEKETFPVFERLEVGTIYSSLGTQTFNEANFKVSSGNLEIVNSENRIVALFPSDEWAYVREKGELVF